MKRSMGLVCISNREMKRV